jgi:hypothetical protein
MQRAACFFALFTFILTFPLPARAVGKSASPPAEPCQKVIFANGPWESEYIDHEGKSLLVVQYQGSHAIPQAPAGAGEDGGAAAERPVLKMSLKTGQLMKNIHIPLAQTVPDAPPEGSISVMFKDGAGSYYGPFSAWEISKAPAGYAAAGPGKAADAKNPVFLYDAVIMPEGEVVLPAGEYELYINSPVPLVRNGDTGMAPAVLIKGVDYAAWKSYRQKLVQYHRQQMQPTEEGRPSGPGEGSTLAGNRELAAALENPKAYTPPKTVGPAVRPAILDLSVSSLVDEIVFDAYNGGKGAVPGAVSIVDKTGKAVGTFQACGVTAGGVANALWVVRPDVVLEPGTYRLAPSNVAAVSGDGEGNPAFAAAIAPMPPPRFDFTGTYSINLDVIKTSTLMGPVREAAPSFTLRSFELTLLDQGETIQLIGKYEGMPFSQTARVTSRKENRVEAALQGSTRVRVPNQALIGALVAVTLEKPPGLTPRLTVSGQGTYQRAATKDKGADYNTYRITGNGSMVTRELPPFVMAALSSRLGSVGSIPGPGSPAQAAAGALFPPLAGVIAQILESAFRRRQEEARKAGEASLSLREKAMKEANESLGKGLEASLSLRERAMKEANESLGKGLEASLSLREKAMKEANESLGKGLYDERETRAWVILAEALAHSDEPDADPYSVGDNERVSGRADEAYADTGGEEAGGEEGYSPDTEEREEYGPALPDPAQSFFAGEQERLTAERDEWVKNLESSLQSADPDNPQAQRLHEQYREYIDYLNGRINKLEQSASEEGRTMVLPVDHTGRTAEVAYDPVTGEWYNTETGNIFDMGRYEKDVLPGFEKDREFIGEQRRRLETRDTAFDRAMDQLVNDQKERGRLLGQLQKVRNQAYGIEPPAPGVGDVQANIDRLINDLSNREISTGELRDRAGRVARVVTGRLTGRTMGEEEGRRLTEGVMPASDRGDTIWSRAKADWQDWWNDVTNVNILAHTAAESGLDVVTGRTWAGMAGRVTLAALTGGYSEIPLSVGEALHDIKQDIEAGESGLRATGKAMGKYVLGELAGAYGEEFFKHSGLQLNPEAVEKLSNKLNTPVGELLWGKEGKEMLEGAVEKAGKGLAGSADSLARSAPDSIDYVRYRGEVRDTAEMIAGKIRAGGELDADDIRKVLRDPGVTRELKSAPEEVRRAYQDALEKNLYDPALSNAKSRLNDALNTDSAFKARIEKEFGPGTRVEVEIDSIRTPGTPTGGTRLNADNDLTGRLKITDASGNTVYRELPAEKLSGVYHEEFAKASGMLDAHGNFNVAKARAEMPDVNWSQLTKEQQLETFAKLHNQEVTDVFSPEAAVDFNKWAEHSLRKDLPGGTSAVDLLKKGDPTASLADPQGLAMMETYKIKEFFNRGGLANQAEAYEQLAKMGKLTGDLTEAYRKLGFPAQDMPENMAKALEVVSNRNLSPGARTLALKELGFNGPEDLANKLAGRIEGLQKLGSELGRGSSGAPTTSSPIVRAVIGAVVGSYLKDNQ